MWKYLKHPNIVPFLGTTLVPLQLISAWMHDGELNTYITNHPKTDRVGLVGVPPLLHRTMLTPSPVIRCR